MMSKADDESKQSLDDKSYLGAKAEVHNKKIPEAPKESFSDAEVSMTNEEKCSNRSKETGRMVVIAGQLSESITDGYKSTHFE